MKTAYLAPVGLEESLKSELTNIIAQYDRLFLTEGPPQNVHWAQNIWYDVQTIPFQSISDAAKKLRALQKLWAFYPTQNVRRGELIVSQLPFFSPKPITFPNPPPTSPLGSFTLIDAQTLLASAHCSSPFANGEVLFNETKIPPSRAYLKLWEIFTKIGRMPKANDICLDIGASPGSWSWVLQNLGAQVIAVDRAPLAIPNVKFLKQDAFSLRPQDLPKLDWICSDVICYPEKLLQWLQQWLPLDINFVCTLKFQGKEDYPIIQEFEKIGNVTHLFHNKHELTWTKLTSAG